MKNIKKYPISLCLILMILLISIADIFNKDIDFSTFENRSLAQKPKFYYSDFESGRFFKSYERYLNDQFLLRNTWINIKSAAEFVLGKKENNGIIYGDKNFLFDKFEDIDEENLRKNIDTLKSFITSSSSNFDVMIIPESFSIYKELLPNGISLVDENQYINTINTEFNNLNNVKSINLIDKFIENKDRYIYYKTDHHWTSLGAYLAYKEFANINNIEAIDVQNLKENRVDSFLGTYFSKAKNFNVNEDYITYYGNNNIDVKIDGVEVDGLNDDSKWSSSDRYSAFLHGNNGLTVITNNSVKDKSKILVIKDSYANSFIQFLINNYNEVYVVDLRSFIGSFNEFYSNNNFDKVLIMYSFKNLVNDVNISRIKY
ncbi:DHHW family protein [Clostridium sp. AL.422]|uniref:DHHW family protein n=1 Tax=Clostridium TaxID=1485 RepID=UPI00293DAE1A|nr:MULTISPECIES: DHHW family protein [unclassified Clostridium]MDV4151623.1 DHHW family protein [Clostridium sp. AL.422]